ncbi:MAG: ABC transporter permease [Candidatus Bathyarchaeota archaeon]|nr:ABC transporter permease [Candidatus Bathyarchaeota archaeon]
MAITRFLFRRAIDRILLVLFVTMLQFIILRVLPVLLYNVDPAVVVLRQAGQQQVRQEEINAFIQSFGLDKPLFPDQFLQYYLSLFRFDFGISFRTRIPVTKEILERLPHTVLLMGSSLAVTATIGIMLGLYSVSKRHTKVDAMLTAFSIGSFVMPAYIVAMFLIIGLAYYPKVIAGISLFPLGGTPNISWVSIKLVNFDVSVPIIGAEYLWHMTLPLLSLVLTSFGAWAYYARQLSLTEIGQDYIKTARAKGLKDHSIMRKHVLRNVSAPVITSIALNIPYILSGTIIVEKLFSWHGLGVYIYDSVLNFDYPAAQAILFIIAIVTAISLYIADIIVALIDPRIRMGQYRHT